MVPVPEIRGRYGSSHRYCPARPLPAYAYLPGMTPHPVRDPRGHSYGRLAGRRGLPSPAPASWARAPEWRYGVDCFNAGFFWEAHESWETLWGCAVRDSAPARLLQGLIQIAAALLKIRLGSAAAAASLAARGLDKLATVAREQSVLLGLDVPATVVQFHHYFRPLAERTLPPLDATVPRLVLSDGSDV